VAPGSGGRLIACERNKVISPPPKRPAEGRAFVCLDTCGRRVHVAADLQSNPRLASVQRAAAHLSGEGKFALELELELDLELQLESASARGKAACERRAVGR